MKGVVRAERLKNPVDFIPAILQRTQTKHLNRHYGIEYGGYTPSGDHAEDLEEAQRFLRMVALKQVSRFFVME